MPTNTPPSTASPLLLRNRVRAERLKHGLTQPQLAQAAGVSERVLAQIERDDGHEPASRVMKRLTALLSWHARQQGYAACGCDWAALWWVEPTRTRPTKQRVA
jgi:transcriptional regulator with XRE-family HTH domain